MIQLYHNPEDHLECEDISDQYRGREDDNELHLETKPQLFCWSLDRWSILR